jgi:hypothetical protein
MGEDDVLGEEREREFRGGLSDDKEWSRHERVDKHWWTGPALGPRHSEVGYH